MPAVFIHGVPDTYRVWEHVQMRLSRSDVITLALPGFDAPLPQEFRATKEEYVTWIIQQIEHFGEPVDIVGHDWGCILTARVASLRPDLIRSWAAGSGPISREYEWHPLAKIWQTHEEGEKWMRELDPEAVAAFMAKAGYPLLEARAAAGRMDSVMRDCILQLYRSAVQVGEEWQPGLGSVSAPGLVFWGERDSACPVRFADELASDTRAQHVLRLDCDHWTLVERSAEVAAALEQHWAINSTK